jgi:hypothetical protein
MKEVGYAIPQVFRNELLASRFLFVEWDEAFPIEELTVERISATIFQQALEPLL